MVFRAMKTGAFLAGSLLLTAGLAMGTTVSQASGATNGPSISSTVQLSCQAPVVGTMTVDLSIAGTVPTSATAGGPASLINVQFSADVPTAGLLEGMPFPGPYTISVSITQMLMNISGATPPSIDLGAAPYGPMVSPEVPTGEPVSFPALASVGPFVASSSASAIVGTVGDTSLSLTLRNGAGPTSPLAITCVPSSGAQVFSIPVTSAQAVSAITGISPSSGPTSGRTQVTITGSGFTGTTGVRFGTQAAYFTVDSYSSIVAISPSTNRAGAVDVTVTTPAGTSATSSADQFTYTVATNVPTVSSIFPDMGPADGGGIAFIFGSNFSGTTAVKFGGKSGLYLVIADDLIIALAPRSVPGKVPVTVTNSAGASSAGAGSAYSYF